MILSIASQHRIRRVDQSDIIMVKAEDKRVVIFVERGALFETIQTWDYTVKSFADAAGLLPVHRKYAVNPDKVVAVLSTPFNTIDLHFGNGAPSIEASRRLTPSVRRALRKPTTSTE